MKYLSLLLLLTSPNLAPHTGGYWTEVPDWYPVYHRTEVLEPIPNEMPLYRWMEVSRFRLKLLNHKIR